jgi:Holliday junction resolvasome RuvABC endonuclease subunit
MTILPPLCRTSRKLVCKEIIMFHIPPNSSYPRLLGIDPGSETLGVACLSVDANTLEIVNTQAITFIGSKLGMNPWMTNVHSARFARIAAHKENLKRVFSQTLPVAIACESPFYNPRRPNAFEVLVETLDMIRQAVWEYDQHLALDLVDPPTVKISVGAKGNADKDVMRAKILALPNLNFTGSIPLHLLDEHSIDAIAVAYSKLQQYRNGS